MVAVEGGRDGTRLPQGSTRTDLFAATEPLRQRAWFGYAFGLVGFLLALWLRLVIGVTLVGYPFITFFPVVILTTFLGGVVPGGLVAVLSGLAAWYFFLGSPESFALEWPGGVMAMGFYVLVVGTDVFLVHVLNRALSRLRAERLRTTALLDQQSIMFQELQHRVANNMQFVASLLAMQQRRVLADPAAAGSVLDEAAGRLQIMARIHRRLHDPAAAGTSFGQHIEAICADLLDATGARNVVCLVDAAQAPAFEPEKLVTLSLIVSEALVNTLKHAFPDGQRGTVRVGLQREAPGRMALTVADDGTGMPENYDPTHSTSLGLKIIRGLAAQLGGDVAVTSDEGTTTRVVFAA